MITHVWFTDFSVSLYVSIGRRGPGSGVGAPRAAPRGSGGNPEIPAARPGRADQPGLTKPATTAHRTRATNGQGATAT